MAYNPIFLQTEHLSLAHPPADYPIPLFDLLPTPPPALTVKAALKAGISKCLSKFLVVPFLTLHSPLSGDTELILRLNGDFWFLGWAVEINVAGRRELGLLQRRREKSI